MNLTIVGNILRIEWEWYEQFWAFNWNQTFEIPLAHITSVTTEEPPQSWTDLRAPGTFFPGLIKAGTYYTTRGREFWYVIQDQPYLVLGLRDQPFQKIVLSVAQNQAWRERIEQSQEGVEEPS